MHALDKRAPRVYIGPRDGNGRVRMHPGERMRITVEVPPELARLLQEEAEREGMTVPEFAEVLLRAGAVLLDALPEGPPANALRGYLEGARSPAPGVRVARERPLRGYGAPPPTEPGASQLRQVLERLYALSRSAPAPAAREERRAR
jgi:ribbon-helix-helix CopG family protein